MTNMYQCDGCGALMAYEDNYALLHGGTKEKQADVCSDCKDLIMDYIKEIKTEQEDKKAAAELNSPEEKQTTIDQAVELLKGLNYIVYPKRAELGKYERKKKK